MQSISGTPGLDALLPIIGRSALFKVSICRCSFAPTMYYHCSILCIHWLYDIYISNASSQIFRQSELGKALFRFFLLNPSYIHAVLLYLRNEVDIRTQTHEASLPAIRWYPTLLKSFSMITMNCPLDSRGRQNITLPRF